MTEKDEDPVVTALLNSGAVSTMREMVPMTRNEALLLGIPEEERHRYFSMTERVVPK